MKLLKLSDKSSDARHTDVVEMAEKFLEKAKEGVVDEVIILFTTEDGSLMHHFAAGVNVSRAHFLV